MNGTPTPTFAELGNTLAPVLARHRDATPHRAALALLAAATRVPGATPGQVRAWVRARSDVPALVAFAADRGRWSRAATDTARYVTLHASPEGRRQLRLDVARRLVGVLLSPCSSSVGRGAGADGARAAAALVGVGQLESLAEGGPGIDAPLLPLPRLAVQMGCTVDTARTALRRAVAAGLVVKVGARRGSANAFRLAAVRDGGTADTLERYTELVDALADGDDAHPGAAAIRAAAHPAVAYGPVGRRGWLALVARAMGLDPAQAWGWPVRVARATVRDLDRAGLLDRAGPDLAAQLDRLAYAVGPDGLSPADRAAQAEMDRQARAATRLDAVRAVRAERDAARRQALGAARAAAAAAEVTAEARATTTVRLPPWWTGTDLDRQRVVAALAARGYELLAIDEDRGVATAARAAAAAS